MKNIYLLDKLNVNLKKIIHAMEN